MANVVRLNIYTTDVDLFLANCRRMAQRLSAAGVAPPGGLAYDFSSRPKPSHGASRGPTFAFRVGRSMMSTITLTYDRFGSRRTGIGPAEITYDRLGSRPRRVGTLDIGYDRAGSRLRSIGSAEIEYDRAGSRARRLGRWELEYDHFGSRPCRVGHYGLDYDKLGSRLVAVGSMILEYDRAGSRVARVIMPGNVDALAEDDLVVLFFVLHGADQSEA